MPQSSPTPSPYIHARDAFRRAVAATGASHTIYKQPVHKCLTTDVAVLGNPDAPKVIIVSSGVHGVELPMGSLLQIDWMQRVHGAGKSDDMKYVFVHALNPYGSAP